MLYLVLGAVLFYFAYRLRLNVVRVLLIGGGLILLWKIGALGYLALLIGRVFRFLVIELYHFYYMHFGPGAEQSLAGLEGCFFV